MNEDRRYILFAFKQILNKEMLIYFKNLNLNIKIFNVKK